MRRFLKPIAVFVCFNFLTEIFWPLTAFALTGGPSQPEVQSFEPIGTTEMVDLSSGDFVYNIPLLDVGGYPINLSYHSGIGMDQEASWVGLGWNVNVGAITRNMRGLPDDFKGDKVKRELNIKNNQTFGINTDLSFEIAGFEGLTDPVEKAISKIIPQELNYGIYYNNYKGLGWYVNTAVPLGSYVNLGLGFDSQSGISVDPSLNVSFLLKSKEDENKPGFGFNVGMGYNSMSGLTSLGFRIDQLSQNANGDVSSVRGIGGGISFATYATAPIIQMPTTNLSLSFNPDLGLSLGGALHPNLKFDATYTGQFLFDKEKSVPAFGYLYAQEGDEKDRVLMDFDREKDEPYMKDMTTQLPIPNFTYDVFSVSGQGVGGAYRAYRSDVGTLFDDEVETVDPPPIGLGMEFGAGAGFHFGGNVKFSFTYSRSGKWSKKFNNVKDVFNFQTTSQNSVFEPAYFKTIGEKCVNNPANTTDEFYSKFKFGSNGIQIDDPIAINIQKDPLGDKAQDIRNQFGNIASSGNTAISRNNSQRDKRTQPMSYLTAQEATLFGLDKDISSYTVNQSPLYGTNNKSTIPRLNPNSKSHHISEITVLKNDGSRYIYGIPAYNSYQVQKTFNVDKTNANSNYDNRYGLIHYEDADETVNNSVHTDHYYTSSELPAYSYANLLTGILSSDYVDVTGDGISDDDLGSAVKFNYTRYQDHYNWRIPVGKNIASFNEGLYSENCDDKANYICGEKEIWYNHSIETKNYIVEFKLSPRDDAFGVKGREDGTVESTDEKGLAKLDQIILYNKIDRIKNGENAVPIKTVHFEYNYELCKNVPNSRNPVNGGNNGKLTLTKVYFTYGNISKEGRLSPYAFYYADPSFGTSPQAAYNPDYNLKGYDRWGNYKKNIDNVNDNTSMQNGMLIGNQLTTSEFPFVNQFDHNEANVYAAAWHLNRIDLPSGGIIKVTYEADDYAYVQDKQAMQMFKIVGATANPMTYSLYESGSNTLYQRKKINIEGEGLISDDNYIDKDYLIFQLEKPISTSSSVHDTLADRYFKNIDKLYFNFCMRVPGNGNAQYEYIPGYIDKEDFGVVPSIVSNNAYTYGWVKIKEVGIKGENSENTLNPIAKAGMTFLRQHLMKKVIKGIDQGDCITDEKQVGLQFIKSFIGFADQLSIMEVGYYRFMRRNGECSEFVPNKSLIRLLNPISKKYGGGSRVQSIKLSDNWAALSGESDFDYGQTYKYTRQSTDVRADGKSVEISSGVAEYEPSIGGDENPFHTPIPFNERPKVLNFFSPSETHYVETPMGESYFPAPGVTYSEVRVENLKRTNVTRHATGYTVNKFYTSKDFPVITRQTDLLPSHNGKQILNELLSFNAVNFQTATQGYVVELNDMNGKPKEVAVYPENQSGYISKVTYYYKTDILDKKQHLNNQVRVIDKDGKVYNHRDLGLDIEVFNDMREHEDHTYSLNLKANLDLLSLIFPVPVGIILPDFKSSHHRLRTAVLTKVIRRSGILEKTEVWDENSVIVNENVAFDANTGEPLVTSTQNEFKEKIYNFSYPAHWAYDGMGGAYSNIGLKIPHISIPSTRRVDQYSGLFPGDEVYIEKVQKANKESTILKYLGYTFPTSKSTYKDNKYWVYKNGSYLYLIDHTGKLADQLDATTNENGIDYEYNFVIVRSGHRNLLSSNIGTVTSKKDPSDVADGSTLTFDNTTILDASALEFSEDWNVFSCWQKYYKDNNNLIYVEPQIEYRAGDIVNPYFIGIKGNWRPKKSYKYVADRNNQDLASSNGYIRNQGLYSSFGPFWILSGSTYVSNANSPWTWVDNKTIYSPYGTELENQNPLGIYSSAIYGYNNTLPITLASNASYKEVGFDGFEDYDYYFRDYYLPAPHFNFLKSNVTLNITNESRHTGKYSLKVSSNSENSLYRSVSNSSNCSTTTPEYTLKKSDIIGTFSPVVEQKYFISIWMKESTTVSMFRYNTASVIIETTGLNGTTTTLSPVGGIINGWEKLEGVITVPSGGDGIKIRLITGTNATFFDDLRIQPFSSTLKTFVYDYISQKLVAELDENNYATYYDYDQSGTLIRVKRETKDGIVTLKESRQNISKH